MKVRVSLVCWICQNNVELGEFDAKYETHTIVLSWDDLQCGGTFLKDHYVEMRQLQMLIVNEEKRNDTL